MSTKDYPSIDHVRQCLREEDGRIFWVSRPREHFKLTRAWRNFTNKWAGKEAGNLAGDKRWPRWVVKIDGIPLYRYQIVWAFHKGEWPEQLDHKDRNQLNDRIDNLRIATQTLNMGNVAGRKNTITGIKGVRLTKTKGRKVWSAQIQMNGKQKHIGCFSTPEEAHAAYVEAAREYFGEFHCP